VTREEAAAVGRHVALDRGWPWVEPVWTVRRRGGLLGLGRAYWQVTSNARQNGDNVIVQIDDTTGRVRADSFVPAEAAPGPAITEYRAIEIAREAAASRGWRWIEPAQVSRVRSGRGGTEAHWRVTSNAGPWG
jgi:hypothetical protein